MLVTKKPVKDLG